MIHFDLPKDKSSIIKVIGVGGGGSNAVNQMFAQGIEGVNFIICNTDAQAIAQSKVPNKIQLGPHLTQGLGAGANPEVGRQATEESFEEIKRLLEVNTKMVFVTAGMGGGTGTGGAPIIARICRDMGILTVGIVTTPFSYEGKKRMAQAEDGINTLKQYVDTLLVISNDKLRHQFGNLRMSEAFAKADNILSTAARCITDVINSTGQINVDFADVCTVMRNGGVAILGNAAAEGDNRAQTAIEEALNSPLLNDNDIQGAKWILLNINSAAGEHEHTMDEVEVIQNYILERAGAHTDVILGMGYDNSLGSKLGITLIATGFEQKDPFVKKEEEKKEPVEEKIVMTLGVEHEERKMYEQAILPLQEETEAPETDMLSPQLVEIPRETTMYTVMPEHKVEKTVEENNGTEKLVLHLAPEEIKPETEQAQPVQQKVEQKEEAKIFSIHVTEKNQPVSTPGGYLSKPSNIYASEEPKQQQSTQEGDFHEKQKTPAIIAMEEPVEQQEMQLVIRETEQEAVCKPMADQVNTETSASAEALQHADVAEDQMRKAAERTKKLRNLSFNFNAADVYNDFENEPAYIRRNLEIHNSLANVEKFYSNYTVNIDDNNEAKIDPNSKNSFLEGEKPD
ncbi:MAG: cell division protein FtsZ [Dinghuibacter sp.]|nr:cell division protein FtsZ [Dinghuibacter sp.]